MTDGGGSRDYRLPLTVLLVAVATDRFGIRIHGLNLRFELLVGGLLLVWALLTQGLGGRGRIGLIEWCLAGWLAAGAVSSVVFSPSPRQSLKLTLLIAGLLVLYVSALFFLRSAEAITWATGAWVAVGMGVAAIGIADALLFIVFGWQNGISFDGSLQNGITILTPKVHSTLWEPNIFGSYLLTVGALAFALSRASAFQSSASKWWLRLAMVLSYCGVVISMSRTVWAVALIQLFAIGLVALRLQVVRGGQLPAALINPGAAGLALGLALALSMSALGCRTSGLAAISSSDPAVPPPAQSGTPNTSGCLRMGAAFLYPIYGITDPGKVSSFAGRRHIAALAFRGWLLRPFLGWGTGAYRYVYGAAEGGWIGNLVLHILFDTGIVGLLLLAVSAGSAVWKGVGALRLPVSVWQTSHFGLLGLLVGAASILLTYQLTEGTWLGFTWAFFALLVAAGRSMSGVSEKQRNVLAAPPIRAEGMG